MSAQPRVSALIWSTDLKLGHLPAVCVRTGQPADASVKFRFVTTPRWAYLMILLVCTGVGLVLASIIMRLVSRSATGRLPYVRAEANRIRLWRWVRVALFVGLPILLVAAVVALGWDTTVGAVILSVFVADLVATIVFPHAVLNRIGPNGYVHDSPYGNGRWIELRRVHPTFAAAVAEMYEWRWAAVEQPAPWQQTLPAIQPQALPPPPV
ncbi:MAG: hypothetical protein M3Z98_08215 [Candidatus Dormibacteraeota bacterium]|nr:hypothetical protein [Candidatus Dormibacteraeota bacterium]